MSRCTLRAAAALAACVAAATADRVAGAQQYLIGGSASASSGIEGGGAGGGLYRTRTRVRLGGDVRIDESPDDIFEFAAIAEIEPRSGFGADVRYARAASERFVLDVGLLGIVAPASLYGACADLTYRLPISKKTQVTVGPEADFFFLGSDLPDGTVIWQVRLAGGLRVDL
ncbi:MAG TPA: hypothetical protein VE987_07085 [Polyangiaceae bacterium]|nr:hypothetical protein [Polyangiaceae bacterium]